jgi:hypothetical protein
MEEITKVTTLNAVEEVGGRSRWGRKNAEKEDLFICERLFVAHGVLALFIWSFHRGVAQPRVSCQAATAAKPQGRSRTATRAPSCDNGHKPQRGTSGNEGQAAMVACGP